MSTSLVTVYQTFNPADAQLICSRLDAARLHASVMNESSSLTMGGYLVGAGGIQVQVPEEEAQDARDLIAATDPAS